MHDFPCVSLGVLILKLLFKTPVCLTKERVSRLVLVCGIELLESSFIPGICRIELRCVLVIAQVHSKRKLIFRVLTRLDQMREVV